MSPASKEKGKGRTDATPDDFLRFKSSQKDMRRQLHLVVVDSSLDSLGAKY